MGCSEHPGAPEKWCGKYLRCYGPGTEHDGSCGIIIRAKKAEKEKEEAHQSFWAFVCPLCGGKNVNADCKKVGDAWRVWCHECSNTGIIRG